mmetsp:Transcript_4949/g.14348  ORF Transcript_4949/g.14348 Transcript_4949/m.14348 type:complete len:215 (-) Transcript_4949:824-1468(-)
MQQWLLDGWSNTVKSRHLFYLCCQSCRNHSLAAAANIIQASPCQTQRTVEENPSFYKNKSSRVESSPVESSRVVSCRVASGYIPNQDQAKPMKSRTFGIVVPGKQLRVLAAAEVEALSLSLLVPAASLSPSALIVAMSGTGSTGSTLSSPFAATCASPPPEQVLHNWSPQYSQSVMRRSRAFMTVHEIGFSALSITETHPRPVLAVSPYTSDTQ